MTDGTRIEVIKIGGSLLKRDDLTASLQHWLTVQQDGATHRVLVVGGGEPVDELRNADRWAPVGETAAHWQAIGLMQENGMKLAAQMPGLRQVCTLAQLQPRLQMHGETLMLPQHFLSVEELALPGTRLPLGWQVTSDSIAARLAVVLGDARLRLLKSRPRTAAESTSWTAAARGGLVDRFFPNLADYLSEVGCELLPGLASDGQCKGVR